MAECAAIYTCMRMALRSCCLAAVTLLYLSGFRRVWSVDQLIPFDPGSKKSARKQKTCIRAAPASIHTPHVSQASSGFRDALDPAQGLGFEAVEDYANEGRRNHRAFTLGPLGLNHDLPASDRYIPKWAATSNWYKMWMVVKITVPFWVPSILGAVLY